MKMKKKSAERRADALVGVAVTAKFNYTQLIRVKVNYF